MKVEIHLKPATSLSHTFTPAICPGCHASSPTVLQPFLYSFLAFCSNICIPLSLKPALPLRRDVMRESKVFKHTHVVFSMGYWNTVSAW
jgi:hypothetical protein